MAATVSSAWGKPGDWALDAEREEEERAAAREAQPAAPAEAEFPSLSVAAAAKPSRKKKAQPVSLAEFTTGKAVTYSAAKAQSRSVGLTMDEALALPTGPRERSAEELERARFGGGFRSYGSGGGGGGFSDRRGGDESRWGSSRASDEPRGPARDLAPSRADEVDDWGAGKKLAPMGSERRDRGGFFESHSRADDSDSWVSNKGHAPPPESRPRRGGFDMFQKEPASNGGADSAESWGRKREEPSSGGRPKLVLQPRTVPLGNGEGNPNSKPKGASPFGEARPREEVLAEKGQNWKKIDEQLESMKIKEMDPRNDGPSNGRKGFGGKSGPAEERTERSWKKPEAVEIDPRSDAVDAVEVAEGVAAN